jgi:hypothetical protein
MQAPLLLKQLENNVGRAYLQIGSLVCTVVVILHLFACLFHYVTLWDERDSWVELSGIVDTSSKVDRYLSALYWCASPAQLLTQDSSGRFSMTCSVPCILFLKRSYK